MLLFKDLEVVADSSKIYYEAPKKKEYLIKNPEPDPPTYAYYEPSEYTASKKIVPTEKVNKYTFIKTTLFNFVFSI